MGGRGRLVWALVAIVLGVAAMWWGPVPGEAARRTLGIFTVATVLWVTEAVPLFVTSFVILVLEVILLGLPGGPLGFAGAEYKVFLSPFFDPVIALFLGGFALGAALNRHRLDLIIASFVLRRVGSRPSLLVLGFLAVTALISMWMSNTATAALMMAVALPVIRAAPEGDPLRKALALAIPFGANLGGMATPVGTPPNLLAIGALARAGYSLSFLRWMALALPAALVLILFTWWLLVKLYPPQAARARITVAQPPPVTWPAAGVMAIFFATVFLWLTAEWHGVPEGIVGIMPVVALFGLGLLAADDLRSLGWDILLIMGGGLSLGVALQQSGLSAWVVERVSLEALPLLGMVLAVGLVTAALTTFISNSAAASLLVPVVVGFGAEQLPLTVIVALAASASMALPISTPPNAIAYGSRELTVMDMLRPGVVITVVSVAVSALAVEWLLPWVMGHV
ncbi:SLC13 family permease [Limnochorda pilosa]|uniref:Transporter n=1 Tax=Limnochorda pilosa TaxID=1555112 RepID=A0A0K2SPH3_LIMPI|nr:DASS family sodium-coupled anion symporter [Limnochorda pilosa]BAS28709.1 transporter [Limnochorda pilosa]